MLLHTQHGTNRYRAIRDVVMAVWDNARNHIPIAEGVSIATLVAVKGRCSSSIAIAKPKFWRSLVTNVVTPKDI
jgi:hypothetical protein